MAPSVWPSHGDFNPKRTLLRSDLSHLTVSGPSLGRIARAVDVRGVVLIGVHGARGPAVQRARHAVGHLALAARLRERHGVVPVPRAQRVDHLFGPLPTERDVPALA